ncbi:hypothetical protein HAZT_HAZT006062 [Hyalella azteca]|uniref:Ig-like domain-containing protein n=1 Tax=Hyalella azteca TaxID=294128 RepID=A0A6A0H984_HYAAZ|nr:hypothetical protein HAZT_HAZT006062 [Hyalella azteca]
MFQLLIGQFVSANGDVISHLNISSARVGDGGRYECVAHNSAGADAHSARLNIYGPPTVRPMGPFTAIAGQDFSVWCPVGGHPITRISWTKDGVELPVSRRQVVDSDGGLTIRQVSATADVGHYSCTAVGRRGSSDTGDFLLTVKVPPRLAPVMITRGTRTGMRAQATCVVQEGDLPIRISWLKDGRLLRSADFPFRRKRSLGINHLSPDRNPFTPDNGGASAHLSALGFDAHAPEPPYASGAFYTNYDSSKIGSFNAHLDDTFIDVLEVPGVHIRHMSQFTSLLVIDKAMAEHSGNYTCAATNAAGTTFSSAVLSVAA